MSINVVDGARRELMVVVECARVSLGPHQVLTPRQIALDARLVAHVIMIRAPVVADLVCQCRHVLLCGEMDMVGREE